MNILLISHTTTIEDGSVAHAVFLNKILPHFQVNPTLMGAWKTGGRYIVEILNGEKHSFSKLKDFLCHIIFFCKKHRIDLIHFHSLLRFELADTLSKDYPLVFTLHNAQFTCLSGNKFFLNSKSICDQDISGKCLVNAYTEKCAGTRHPIQLWRKYTSKKKERNGLDSLYKIIISPSLFIKNESTKRGIKTPKIHHLPYPLEIQTNQYTRRNPTFNILFSGRLEYQKGVHLLPEIIQKILVKHPEVEFNIAGDGILNQWIQDQLHQKGLKSNSFFHDWQRQDQLFQLLVDADIIIIPSIYPDNFPVVCLEAMAFAKPVVTFDVGGLPEMIENEYNGFVVTESNITAMSQRVNWLIEHNSERITMGQNGYSIFKKRYTPNVIMPQLINLYKMAIQ